MFSNFDEESRKVLTKSKEEMQLLKHPYIGTEHLILAMLKNDNYKATKIFNKYGITYNKFKDEIIKIIGVGKESNEWFLYTPLLKRIIEEAIIISREQNLDEIRLEHILAALFDENEGVAIRIMLGMNINIEKLSKEFLSKKGYNNNTKKKLLIEDYGYNMNELAKKNELDPVIGREQEINRIIEILCRRIKNNPLLIGDAGVGKTAIVEELSKRINDGLVPDKIKNKKIISLSMSSLIAGTKYRGEFEERINKLLKEVSSSTDIILFIDEIHTLVGAGGAEGAIDASNILKPFLARGKLKLIGATTTDEYKKFLENDHALDRRFQTVMIEEPQTDEVLEILKKLKPIYESFHNVIVKDEILNLIVTLTDKYIYNRKQPDKSIDILDEVCSKVSVERSKNDNKLDDLKLKLKDLNKKKNVSIVNQNFLEAAQIKNKENFIESEINKIEYSKLKVKERKEVTAKAVGEIIKLKTNIPVYEVISSDIASLKKIEKTLNSKVIGQEEAIAILSKDIKRIKLGYKNDKKPQSYLFVGPSGVGKTMLAKELNKIINNNKPIIRLDMSEYNEEHSISKIIGSPPGYVGYAEKTTILDEIKFNPNAIILLDEIEKANSKVINLFLQALDEGVMKTSTNEIVKMNNNIIIMTSNIGFKQNGIGFNKDESNRILDNIKNILGLEITNRIGKILMFNFLNEKNIKKIIMNEIKETEKYFSLTKDNFIVKERVIEQIIKESKYQEFGARRISKIIKSKIYDTIIDEKLNKKIKITIDSI